MLSAAYSNPRHVAPVSDGCWKPNYRIFTLLINDDGLSLIIGPLLKRDLPKIMLASRRFRALYQPCLQSALKDPVNARLEAASAPMQAPLRLYVNRKRTNIDDSTGRYKDSAGRVIDLLCIGTSNVPSGGPIPYRPVLMGLLDYCRCSFVIKFKNFVCAAEHVDVIHSRDSIPPYDGVGEDPQDRDESCFGTLPNDPDVVLTGGYDTDDELASIKKRLVLKLNGRRWVGVYMYYSEDLQGVHNCMFAFRRTAKGACSALLLIRDVISHIHGDICPPIPPLFRE
jgi:hypothetical protein